METHKTVIATHTLVGYHRWPDAPEERSYLADKHRHLFGLRIEVEVTLPDREIEFHDVVDFIHLQWRHGHDFGSMSCEDIAQELLERFLSGFGDDGRTVVVEVWEDGENGARIKRWRVV